MHILIAAAYNHILILSYSQTQARTLIRNTQQSTKWYRTISFRFVSFLFRPVIVRLFPMCDSLIAVAARVFLSLFLSSLTQFKNVSRRFQCLRRSYSLADSLEIALTRTHKRIDIWWPNNSANHSFIWKRNHKKMAKKWSKNEEYTIAVKSCQVGCWCVFVQQ